ncbi:uncharacterized protein MONBRDRAFT_27628 [Monosiga brevicollis MX1]|uniref:[Histone H3]-trimethyl-L-lysine(9) demethylase n=1 Tax=Monosiga brevicollis TaxID=81824 RepID=A9V5U7_MONBE|nr:uncharacterized protein MONBRDRAFT_27628 [Monosiga brevicollis MX1]EDQ87106.1 predicted protein [Monosiga brevicollis MX1]|eukprot:XP_001748049.1 hypothetical protein [Monosiga brevicollis MX1]
MADQSHLPTAATETSAMPEATRRAARRSSPVPKAAPATPADDQAELAAQKATVAAIQHAEEALTSAPPFAFTPRLDSFEVEPDGVYVFRPTLAEMKDFSEYVRFMELVGAHREGIAKVIAPSDYCPRKSGYDLDGPVGDFVVRSPIKQVSFGSKGLYFVENQVVPRMSARKFAAKASKTGPPAKAKDNPCAIERAFWRSIGFAPAIYGADVEGSLTDDDAQGWRVANLGTILDTVTDREGRKLPGVNTAYLYFGMWKAMFCWHTEDMDLYSINYIHTGAPKQWYAISPDHAGDFERLAHREFATDYHNCRNFLRHKTSVISPAILQASGVPMAKTVHRAGEFIITFPRAYHAGFNHGFNIAESTNFATNRWVDFGMTAEPCLCREDTVRINMDPFVERFRPAIWQERLQAQARLRAAREAELARLRAEEEAAAAAARAKAEVKAQAKAEARRARAAAAVTTTKTTEPKPKKVKRSTPPPRAPRPPITTIAEKTFALEVAQNREAAARSDGQVNCAVCQQSGTLTTQAEPVLGATAAHCHMMRVQGHRHLPIERATAATTPIPLYLQPYMGTHDEMAGAERLAPGTLARLAMTDGSVRYSLQPQPATNSSGSSPSGAAPTPTSSAHGSIGTGSPYLHASTAVSTSPHAPASTAATDSATFAPNATEIQAVPEPDSFQCLPPQHPRPMPCSAGSSQLSQDSTNLSSNERPGWAITLGHSNPRVLPAGAVDEGHDDSGLRSNEDEEEEAFKNSTRPGEPHCESVSHEDEQEEDEDDDVAISDALLRCHWCGVVVHRDCYGVQPHERAQGWRCDRCVESAFVVRCALCPIIGGAFKRVVYDARAPHPAQAPAWVHMACMQQVLEAHFEDSERKTLVDLRDIPVSRYRLRCSLCNNAPSPADLGITDPSIKLSAMPWIPASSANRGKALGACIQTVLLPGQERPSILTFCLAHAPKSEPEPVLSELEMGERVYARWNDGLYYRGKVLRAKHQLGYLVQLADGNITPVLPAAVQRVMPDGTTTPCAGDDAAPTPDTPLLVAARQGPVPATFVGETHTNRYQVAFDDGYSATLERRFICTSPDAVPTGRLAPGL